MFNMRSGHDPHGMITTNWFDSPHMKHLEPHVSGDLNRRLETERVTENVLGRFLRKWLGG